MSSRTRLGVAIVAMLLIGSVLLRVADRSDRRVRRVVPAGSTLPAAPVPVALVEPRDGEAAVAAPSTGRAPVEPSPARAKRKHRRNRALAQRPTEGRLRIQVLARETGESLSGILLTLQADAGNAHARVVSSTRRAGNASLVTGASGRAEFLVPEGVAFLLQATSETRVARPERIEIEPFLRGEERSLEVALTTLLDRVCHGRVIDEETGFPLAGAEVSLLTDPDSGIEVVTDSRGRFELPTASWLELAVCVEMPGYASVRRGLAGCEQSTRACDIPLLRSATLDVFVTDVAGTALGGAVVWAHAESSTLDGDREWSGRTDASGRCLLQGLPARTRLSLRAKLGPALVVRRSEELELEPGETRRCTRVVRPRAAAR